MNNQNNHEITELNQAKNFLGKLSELFINRYRMSYLLIMMIVFLGVTSYNSLPRESMPDVTMPYAVVTTIYSGASPEDVESLVTDKIESAISELDDVEDITSTSYLGYSVVSVEFSIGSDMEMKKMLMNNEILEVSFPEDVENPKIKVFATSSLPIMRMSITGDYDMYTLTQLAEDIKDEISKVEGVGNVEVNGGLEQEIHIIVDPVKLNNYGFSLNSFKTTLSNSNINMPLGNEDLDDLFYSIRVDEQFKSIEDIEHVLLKTSAGDLIFLKDVAAVVDTHEDIEEIASMYIAGNGSEGQTFGSVNITIERDEGADVVGASEKIQKLLKEEKGKSYPEDLTVYITYNQADDVSEDLADVTENAISGLIVVIIVLFLFIGFSESLIVAFVIPMAMLSALGIMYYSGISLNGLSILGLIVSLGLLVDNAIVIMENVDRMRHLGLDRKTASKVGTNQVAMSVFAATMTTIAAFIPLTMIPGTMGEFIKSIPQAVIITIAVSFIISLVITPTLCSRYLPKEKKSKLSDLFGVRVASVLLVIILSGYAFRIEGEVGIITIVAAIIFGSAMFAKQFLLRNSTMEDSKIINWYEKTLKSIIESKKKRLGLIGIGMILLVMSLATLPLGIMKIEMMPEEDPTSIAINLEAPQGTTIKKMEEITSEVQEILFTKDYIESFSSTVGGSEKNISVVDFELIDDKLREKDGLEIIEEIREEIKVVPGVTATIEGSAMGAPGSGADISIGFVGEDINLLRTVANEHLEALRKVDGVASPKLNIQEGAPQIQFDINSNKAKALGLSPNDIASELRSYIGGVTATTIKLNSNEVDVVIKLDSEDITTTEQLNKMFITLGNGDKIPVSTVAEVVEVDGLSQIKHDNYERVIKVEAGLKSGFNSKEVLNEFEANASEIIVPDGIEIVIGGEAEEITESFGDLGTSMMLAVILVYGILAIQFNSITQPFVIVMTIPMATIGVILGLLITGNNFGFYAFMGLVSLVGIAVNDAIVLVDYINYVRSTGKELVESIVEAGKTRFIPVFATTITTCGGILPLAVKNPYYAQLGYSLIFGLIVATVLTLVFIPIFYSLIEGRKIRKSNKNNEAMIKESLAQTEV